MVSAKSKETMAGKRQLAEAGLGIPDATKKLRHYHHHHRTKWRQQIAGNPRYDSQDSGIYDTLFRRAIWLVLQSLGYEDADSIAMESFVALTNEYMHHFLAVVNQSMTSGRRTIPIASDFLTALNAHDLTLSSLLPHLKPPIPPSKAIPPPLTVDAAAALDEAEDPAQLSLIEALLRDASLSTRPHVPANFPQMPSQHTYRADPVYSRREQDPKRIRELVSQEGLLGEEALRKLVRSSTKSQQHLHGEKGGAGTGGGEAAATNGDTAARQKRAAAGAPRLSNRERAHLLWKEAMEASIKADEEREEKERRNAEDGMDVDEVLVAREPLLDVADRVQISAPVNADRVNWRKPASRKSGVTQKS